MDIDYDDLFYMWQLYEYNNIRIYAKYELIEEIDYYLDYYKSLDKYILTDYYGYVYKINGNESIDIYYNDEIFGYIDLITNEKYLVDEKTLYLSDFYLLFNFREFFINVNGDEFIHKGEYYYYYIEEYNISFDINIKDYSLYIIYYDEGFIYSLDLSFEDFESFDFSEYLYADEQIVDIKLRKNNSVLNIDNYVYDLSFFITYNTGVTREFTYIDLYSMFYIVSEIDKYETIISIYADDSFYTINLSEYEMIVYDPVYGVLFSFDYKYFIYQDDLEALGDLPVIEGNDYFLESKEIYYYGYLVMYDDLINKEMFNSDVYYLDVEYKLKSFDSLKDSFLTATYVIFYSGSGFTIYYDFNLNNFYAINPWKNFYVSFNEEEFIYQDIDKLVIIPMEKFNTDSFKVDVVDEYGLGMIFEYLYIIYDSFNNRPSELVDDVIIFPDMKLEIRYSSLYSYIYNDWYETAYIELSYEEFIFEEFNNLVYEYELIINNDITNSIYYYSNTNNIYFRYEFLASFFLELYNYNEFMEVDYESVFDVSQFDYSNVIEVFGLYGTFW